MRVAVMGAGVVGIATAFELLRDGHEVVVIDRQAEPAAETSFANAGMVAPGHAYVWSSPKALRILAKALLSDDQAFRFRFQADPRFWRWCWKFARQCTTERAALNTARKVRLCLYSQERLHEVVAETGVAYGARAGGALYLFRDPAALAAAAGHAQILRDQGVAVEAVTAGRAAELDPAYAPVEDRIAGALHAPGDESGDARLFTLALAERCREQGADLRLGHTIRRIEALGGAITGIVTDKGRIEAEAYVMALGCQSAAWGRSLGIDLPIYPVKGYSVTLPIGEGHLAPTLSGVDEQNLLAFANFGDRLRLTAIAEFSGYDTSHKPEDFTKILADAKSLFPDAGDYTRPRYWAGLRPMTPTNLPIVGPSRYRNLWLNCGHGHMGWTWACGTARIAADLLLGWEPAIPQDGLSGQAA
jgi:D-amino-acid dehydrogenase